MRWLTADFHIHSVLSPCGDLSMSPRAVAARARAVGLDLVALSDHNSARNAPALRAAARQEGLAALYGSEVRTAEEVDLLCLFDDADQAVEFGEWAYGQLPAVACDPRVFGDQVVVDASDEIVEFVERLLIGSISATLDEVVVAALRRGGLVIPAHVDRSENSLISQLGWLPDDLPVDAVELSKFGDEQELAGVHPWLAQVPVVRFSDAHLLADVGYQQTAFRVAAPSVAELRLALAGRDGRESRPIRRALPKEST